MTLFFFLSLSLSLFSPFESSIFNKHEVSQDINQIQQMRKKRRQGKERKGKEKRKEEIKHYMTLYYSITLLSKRSRGHWRIDLDDSKPNHFVSHHRMMNARQKEDLLIIRAGSDSRHFFSSQPSIIRAVENYFAFFFYYSKNANFSIHLFLICY